MDMNGVPGDRNQERRDRRGRSSRAEVESAMTQRARRARAKLRLTHLAEWQRHITSLFHHNPDYPYDINHEYLEDWTSDPDYVVDAVSIREYDGNGMRIYTRTEDLSGIQTSAQHAVNTLLGNRVAWGFRVFFDEEVAMDLDLITGQGIPKNAVVPDLVVLPQSMELPEGQERPFDDRSFRLDRGDPAPELVIEIMSRGTADKDLGEKKRLYELLGIGEYLVYDTGGQRADDSPAELLVFKLEDGAYRQLECDPQMSEPEKPAFFSDVFGTHIRMNGVDWEMARLQWHDPVESRWRDHETDKEEQYRAEGTLETTIAVLHKFLRTKLAQPKRKRIEAVWREEGLPPDVLDRILAVQRTPKEWRSLMAAPDGS